MQVRKRTKMGKMGMMTPMEPSRNPSSLCMASTVAADENGWEKGSLSGGQAIPVTHPEEPRLNCIPEGVFPTYQPMPLPLRLLVVFLSFWTSAVTTWRRLTWLQPLAILKGWKKTPPMAEVVGFVAKGLLLMLFTQTLIQDLFLPPSRLTMEKLLQQYFLPSSLSKYESLDLSEQTDRPKTLKVHYLEYSNKMKEAASRFDTLYLNHGFGANSLSWLPAIPSLTQRLRARVCVGHDAVGLGFSERPENLELFSTKGSATIGTKLLLQKNSAPKSVALFGHSMGSISTLKMALLLPKETSKFIVLCAPALGFQVSSSKQKKHQGLVGSFIRERLAYPISGYILRRVVGTRNFWKKALQQFWGNPQRVSDSDALRFQWPAIMSGWERGLLDFSRAQTMHFETSDVPQDDKLLLRRVLELPNTRVFVVLGSKDVVVPPSRVRKFFEEFQDSVPIVEMEGLGHDAFEEDPEAFCCVVDEFLKDYL